MATEVVAHSPTPSIVSTTASSNGDGKNTLAAWLRWCSLNSSSPFQLPVLSTFFSALSSRSLRNSFSLSHSGIDMRNDWKPWGANAR